MAGRTVRGRVVLPAFWYSSKNFGDALVPDLIGGLHDVTLAYLPSAVRPRLFTLGSILEHAGPGDIVCGTGTVRPHPLELAAETTVLAVRGPRTRAAIRGIEVPQIYGDPAQLLPLVYQPTKPARRYEVGVVPHYTDIDAVDTSDPAAVVINPRWPWRRVVDHIASCDRIVSSSLHGIIVAEAYGIPAAWMQLGDRVTGGTHKFLDYFEGSGRDVTPPIRPGLDLDAQPLPPLHVKISLLREALATAVELAVQSVHH